MKKLIIALLALASSIAFGTTLNPVQLLNPAGSTSGQAIVSTGPSGAPGWGSVSASALTPVTGTAGSVVLSNLPTLVSGFSVSNGSDVITANNNANNVLVFSSGGGGTAKSLATLSRGNFIASSDTNVNDGAGFHSDAINTMVVQGLNSSGTSGYDTNLTTYRPAATNNTYIGPTMSATPGAEQHLWMGTDYANSRYVFTETITGTGSYLPITFLNGQAQVFQIGTGTTPTTTFSGGGVVLNGTEGNQVTWTLGGQTWSWNMASGGNFYVHDGTNNKFPLAIAPNASAALTMSGATSAFTGAISATTTGAMPLYGTTGTAVNAPHMVNGTVALSAGSATVTLSGAAVFTSSSSYVCTANDDTGLTAVRVNQTSGTSVTFTGTTTDTVGFMCAGN